MALRGRSCWLLRSARPILVAFGVVGPQIVMRAGLHAVQGPVAGRGQAAAAVATSVLGRREGRLVHKPIGLLVVTQAI